MASTVLPITQRLLGLWPVTTLVGLWPLGPLFGKEMRVMSRRKRTYVLRAIFLGALLLLLVAVSSEMSLRSEAVGTVQTLQRQVQLGTTLFQSVATGCVVVILLIAPILTCSAISSERLGKTLPVLLMTPLSAWQIASGKLASRLLTLFMLLALTVPVLAVVQSLGGTRPEALVAFMLIASTAALSHAALGLFFSCIFDRSYIAILASYLTMGLLYIALPIFGMLFLQFGGFQTTLMSVGMWAMVASNPIVAIVAALDPGAQTQFGQRYYAAPVFHFLVGIGLLMLTSVLIRGLSRKMHESSGGFTSAAPEIPLASLAGSSAVESSPNANEAVQSLQYAAAGTSMSFAKSRVVGDNPVLWRETHQSFGRQRWAQITVGVIAVFLLGLSYWSLWSLLGRSESQYPFAFVFHSILLLLALVFSASAISHEREADTWDLLLTTPLSGRKIIGGKLLGVLRRLAPLFGVITLHFVGFGVLGNFSVLSAMLVLLTMVSFTLPWIACGLALSLWSGRATTAVVTNLGAALFVYAGLPLVLSIADAMPRNRSFFWLYQPYFNLGSAIDIQPWCRPFIDSEMNDATAMTLQVLFASGVNLAIAAAILAFVVWKFDRLVKRSPG